MPQTNRILQVLLILLASAAAPTWAITEEDLLPVEEAFALNAEALDAQTIRLTWVIADGYYLYRHRLAFETDSAGVMLGDPILPSGKAYEDEFFGEVETYRQRLEVLLPVTASGSSELSLRVGFQGCADLGVCYPPHRQTLTVHLPQAGGASMPLSAALGTPATGTLDLGAGPSPGSLAFDDAPLPEDQAFLFEAIALTGNEILARWTIAPGYYLYRDQVAFEIEDDGVRLLPPTLPAGESLTDDHFGAVEIWRGQVEVSLALARDDTAAGTIALTGHYRGCKDDSICYPPIVRTVSVELPAGQPVAGGTARVGAVQVIDTPMEPGTGKPTAERIDDERIPEIESQARTAPAEALSESDRLARALDQDSLWTLMTFFGFGLLLAFTPCVFPMVPILSGIIAGQGKDLTTARAFWLSSIYVLAMALTYTAAGVIAGLFGQNLQAAFQNAWVLAAFAALFVALSLSMFGFYELQLPSALQTRLNQWSNRQQGGTFIGVAIMGVLSALIVGPCVAPPLAAALIVIGQSGDPVLGGMALFALALGMGAPLIAVGTGAGHYLPRAGAWMDAVKAVFGVGLLALALWMLERILDPFWILLGWGALLSASGVYLGALERLPEPASGWQRLRKSLGVFLLILAVLELIGAAAGGRDWIQPLRGILPSGQAAGEARTNTFRTIKSVDELERVLAASEKPVMLDFYADWCVDCKRMERYTFPEPPVSAALGAWTLLKADVTRNDELDQALLRRFGLIGPPAILFFDSEREMRAFRVIGYRKPDEFARHLEAAHAASGKQS